jgi:hypothetical protein
MMTYRTFLRISIVLVCSWPSDTAKAAIADWGRQLTFHASFDDGPNADVAAGDAKIHTATNLSRQQVAEGLTHAAVRIDDNGRWGKCLRFTDTTESVVFFHGADNVPYSADGFALTVSFWMRLNPDQDLKPGYVDPLQITDKEWNNAALFVDFTKDDQPRHFRLGVFSDYRFWNPQDTPWDDIAVDKRPMVEVARPPFSATSWTHVAFVLDGVNSGRPALAQLYLNGRLQGKLSGPQKFTWDPQRLAIMLGIQYIGAIDDFAVFRGAMSVTEIAELMQLEDGVRELWPEGNANANANANVNASADANAADGQAATAASAGEWKQLFNGRNLDGWQPKIRGYELGDNFGNTFRVVDGVIQVGYEQYDQFDQRYGHLFYEQPYASYDLRVEYRFVGDQARGGEGWALRNSGIMLHGQDPRTMGKDQRFPVSIEVQLLGGSGRGTRSTANLCTPGTHVVMNGQLIKRHCTNSTSQTYHGDQWVTVLVRVRGNRLIEHTIDGETVLSYTEPQLDDADEDARPLLAAQDRMLSSGTISLQSESHPVEFRKVELRVVENE